MAKLLYNLIAVEDTSTKWVTNTTVYDDNYILIESDTGIMKQGNGVDVYADLGTLGAKQVAKVEDITDFPATMPPSAHDHEVEADVDSGLAAASTIQALAIALSARIKALEDLAST